MLVHKINRAFIPILWLMSLALAEPPVSEGYPGASSHGDHSHDHGSDHQRSLSQEYGPPNSGSSRSAPSTGYEYSPPNARSFSNARGQSRFPPATVRVSFNQRFGSPNARSSAKDGNTPTSRSSSQEYSAPIAQRGISQEYGIPAARSPSQDYGVPSIVSARTLSTEYGMPDSRSTPSQEYGVPVVAARNNQKPNLSSSSFRSAQSTNHEDHFTPAARSQSQTDSHNAPSGRSNDTPKSFLKSSPASRNIPSSSYGAPSSLSQSVSSSKSLDYQNYNSDSEMYSAPNQRDIAEVYGIPSSQGLSQEYGVPSGRANQMIDGVSPSYSAARSSPSSTYLPVSRNAVPSEQYGVPERDDARARALEEKLRNQEPANYDFGYQIEDQESGSDFGHTETREEDSAQGSYFVVLPDGTKQTVEYEADERGFRPRISVESAAGGYDEDAAGGAGAGQGPY